MSFASLLSETATVLTFTAGDDPRGDGDVGVWTAGVVSPARFTQKVTGEALTARDTTTADWLLYLPAGVTVGPHDRVRDGAGHSFDVVGLPAVAHTPAGPHHLEVQLRYVDD